MNELLETHGLAFRRMENEQYGQTNGQMDVHMVTWIPNWSHMLSLCFSGLTKNKIIDNLKKFSNNQFCFGSSNVKVAALEH